MTTACECDFCGILFRPAIGNLSLPEVAVTIKIDADGSVTQSTWSGVDCCAECGAKVLDLIRPALQGVDAVIREALSTAAAKTNFPKPKGP